MRTPDREVSEKQAPGEGEETTARGTTTPFAGRGCRRAAALGTCFVKGPRTCICSVGWAEQTRARWGSIPTRGHQNHGRGNEGARLIFQSGGCTEVSVLAAGNTS